eukprot:2629512-Rhodomonas_salina.1
MNAGLDDVLALGKALEASKERAEGKGGRKEGGLRKALRRFDKERVREARAVCKVCTPPPLLCAHPPLAVCTPSPCCVHTAPLAVCTPSPCCVHTAPLDVCTPPPWRAHRCCALPHAPETPLQTLRLSDSHSLIIQRL